MIKWVDEYLVCIDNSNAVMFHESINPIKLTIGKSYKILNSHKYKTNKNNYYTITIVDDSLVVSCDYRIERFITLEQWREKQLNRLGL